MDTLKTAYIQHMNAHIFTADYMLYGKNASCCRDEVVYPNPVFTNDGMETIKDETIPGNEEDNVYDEIKYDGVVAGETAPTSLGYATTKSTQASQDKPNACKESPAQYEKPTSPKYVNKPVDYRMSQEEEYVLPDIPYRRENPYITQNEAHKAENDYCTSLQHSVNQPPSSSSQ